MKRKLVILIFLWLFAFGIGGCRSQTSELPIIDYTSGVYFDKNWNEEIGSYKQNVIPSKEVAVSIAVQIFEGMEKSQTAEDYIPLSVFYDEVDGIWIIYFGENNNSSDDNSVLVVGGGCSIAIQETDGKVLRIWFGE